MKRVALAFVLMMGVVGDVAARGYSCTAANGDVSYGAVIEPDAVTIGGIARYTFVTVSDEPKFRVYKRNDGLHVAVVPIPESDPKMPAVAKGRSPVRVIHADSMENVVLDMLCVGMNPGETRKP